MKDSGSVKTVRDKKEISPLYQDLKEQLERMFGDDAPPPKPKNGIALKLATKLEAEMKQEFGNE